MNSGFGSGIVIDGTGVLMNNEMDDFVSAPGIPNQFGLIGGEANKIEPFKRPLSSMTPTHCVTGRQAGLCHWLSRRFQNYYRCIYNSYSILLEFKMEISDATVAPRIHHQWKPDVLMLEKGFDIHHAAEN